MSIAAHAAAELKKKLNREEEQMTNYRRDELEQTWEFKIVRSASGAFRDPLALGSAVEEEGLGGWDLLEKFDNQRLRFRRPLAARAADGDLPAGYDPYRTQIGIGEGTIALYWVLGALAVMSAFVALIAWASGTF